MQPGSPQATAAQSRLGWVVLPGLAYISLLFAVMAIKGVAISPDGFRERAVSSLLSDANWLPWRYLPNAAEHGGQAHSALNFLAYDYLVAAIIAVGKQNWALAHGAVNALLIGATLALGAQVLLRVATTKLTLGFYWAFAFSGVHLAQWAFVTQSEPLYTLELAALILVAVAAFVRDDGKRPWLLAATLAALGGVIFLTRPTSPPVVSVAVWLAVLALIAMHGTPAQRRLRYLWSLGVLGAGLVGTFLFGSLLLSDSSVLPDGSALGDAFIELYTPRANAGQVVWDRPETYISEGEGFGQALKIAALRLPMFFKFWAANYSGLHNLVNSFFYPALYLFALIGMWAGLSNRSDLTLGVRAVIWVALPLVLAIPVFHSFTLLDFNWRYRTPTYPAFFLIAAIGAGWAVEAFVRRRRARQSGLSE